MEFRETLQIFVGSQKDPHHRSWCQQDCPVFLDSFRGLVHHSVHSREEDSYRFPELCPKDVFHIANPAG